MKLLSRTMGCILLAVILAVILAGTEVQAAPGENETGSYSTALINIESRDATDLSGQWHYIVDPLKIGVTRAQTRRYVVFQDVAGPEKQTDFLEYNFDASPRMSIPGDWNGQDVSLTWYDGLVWFRRTIDLEVLQPGRLFLDIGAANYMALVYVNGEKVGEYEDAYASVPLLAAFRSSDTALLAGDVYALEDFQSSGGKSRFGSLPLADFPLVIAERSEIIL